jgi:UDP-N-acetylglucosamine 4,6-dehydratase
MVRHLLTTTTPRICIFSRDEAKQAAMRAAIADPKERLRWFIGDVRDQQRLRRAMTGVEVVIHAAALKRVEVGEYNPAEMVKTNVLGTMNVIEAATDAGVQKVVALSSDKACQPLNAYGASKLMLEKLVLGANNARGRYGPIFAVSRYGTRTV